MTGGVVLPSTLFRNSPTIGTGPVLVRELELVARERLDERRGTRSFVSVNEKGNLFSKALFCFLIERADLTGLATSGEGRRVTLLGILSPPFNNAEAPSAIIPPLPSTTVALTRDFRTRSSVEVIPV
jgi:hypothetical protein